MATRQNRFRNKVEENGVRGIILYILIPVIIILGAVVFKFMSDNTTRQSSYEQIEYINSFMHNGELNDYANKIGMKNWEEDIKWFYEKDDGIIKIDYGYMKLTFTIEEFNTEPCKTALQSIGITSDIVKTKEGTMRLKLYYNGQELERWIS